MLPLKEAQRMTGGGRRKISKKTTANDLAV